MLSFCASSTLSAFFRSPRVTVKVRLANSPSAETFCTIMSTEMPASASGPKMEAETPGLSLTLRMATWASSRE